MKRWNTRLGLLFCGVLCAPMAQAATTVTGQISSTVILTNACQVNGVGGATGLNFGSMNFGTNNALFTSAGGQVLGGDGGTLSILCSAGTIPVVKFQGGSNDGQSPGGTRAMYDGTANYIPYDLYTDSVHTTILPINGTVTLPISSGVAQRVNIYGRAVGKPGLTAGVYTDTISVQLTF